MTAFLLVFVGCYLGGGDQPSLVTFRLDLATGQLTRVAGNAQVAKPSWMALHPGGRLLYAVSEVADYAGEASGSLAAFAIAPDGQLELVGRHSTRGPIPCYVSLSPDARWALTAAYSGASATLFPIAADGTLAEACQVIPFAGTGPDPKRQEQPHPHSAVFSPDGAFAFVQDLGTDRLWQFRLDPAARQLLPNQPPAAAVEPGSGPRHLVFHPDGRHAYATTEMLNTLVVFDYDPARGTLDPVQTVPMLPAGFAGKSYASDLHLAPGGAFLYASNRGHDSLVICRVDPATGRLTVAGHHPTGGNFPRGFGIDPTGRWLIVANQNADNLRVLGIDKASGALSETGIEVKLPRPVCVRFLTPAE